MPKELELKGKRFGKLLVERKGASDNGTQWWCICDCGNKTIYKACQLGSGRIVSCGCVHKQNQEKFYERSRKNATMLFWKPIK